MKITVSYPFFNRELEARGSQAEEFINQKLTHQLVKQLIPIVKETMKKDSYDQFDAVRYECSLHIFPEEINNEDN